MSPLDLLAAGLFLAVVFFAYVIGSVSFAVVISRLMGLADPRSYGSKNPGATNVLRSGSKVAALAVLILDGAKGAFAMWLTALFTVGQSLVFLSAEELLALVGFAAFIGHLYPLFHRFQGGKGVATLLGILLFLHWPTGLTMGVVWLLTAKFSGYSSLAALIGSAVAALLFIALFHTDLQGAIVLAMVVILWLRHRGNLQRLLRREEGKINR